MTGVALQPHYHAWPAHSIQPYPVHSKPCELAANGNTHTDHGRGGMAAIFPFGVRVGLRASAGAILAGAVSHASLLSRSHASGEDAAHPLEMDMIDSWSPKEQCYESPDRL